MRKFRNYIFDQGNVVLNIDPQLTLDAFEPLLDNRGGGDITVADLLGGAVGPLVGDYQTGKISTDSFLEAMLQSMKKGVSKKQVYDAWNALIQDVPDVRREALLRLRRSGAKVYMLSNTNDAHMERICSQCFDGERANMLRYFDELFLSNEMGVAKPSREIFEEVIRRTGVKPEESIFVDDIQANLDTAAEMGFNTLLSAGGTWVKELLG